MPNTNLRQRYQVHGGWLEIKLTTEHPLSTDELRDFGVIATGCEEYAARWAAMPDPEKTVEEGTR